MLARRKMLIGLLERGQIERYDRMKGRFEEFGITSVFQSTDTSKVIGFYGHLAVKGLEIHLEEITAAFFLETNETREEWRTQTIDLLTRYGWKIHKEHEGETVATKDEYQIRLQHFFCPECDKPVFSCLLCYPISDAPPRLPVKEPWCRKRFATIRESYRPYEVRTKGKAHLAENTSLREVVALLQDHRVVAFTGAGISKASGIPTFSGPQGLETRLKITKKGFFDDFSQSLFEKPRFVVTEVARFKTSFLMAKPNAAHLALAELEQRGIVNYIITENGDKLHQEAGSNNVIEIYELDDLKKHFLETREGWEAIDSADIFLVVGVGWDEHGLIEHARDYGLQILTITPERPSFMTEGDLYLNDRAEESLPKIVKALET